MEKSQGHCSVPCRRAFEESAFCLHVSELRCCQVITVIFLCISLDRKIIQMLSKVVDLKNKNTIRNTLPSSETGEEVDRSLSEVSEGLLVRNLEC